MQDKLDEDGNPVKDDEGNVVDLLDEDGNVIKDPVYDENYTVLDQPFAGVRLLASLNSH